MSFKEGDIVVVQTTGPMVIGTAARLDSDDCLYLRHVYRLVMSLTQQGQIRIDLPPFVPVFAIGAGDVAPFTKYVRLAVWHVNDEVEKLYLSAVSGIDLSAATPASPLLKA